MSDEERHIKVESIDFRLRQIMASSGVTLPPPLWKPWKRLDQILFPGPGQDGP